MPIFISYSRADNLVLADLFEDLDALGYAYWFDKELTGGEEWWSTILTQLRECSLVLLVTTPASLASEACRSEYTYALALNKRVVPILSDSSLSAERLPKELRRIQAVNYSTADRRALRELARALSVHTALPPTSLPKELPPEPAVPTSVVAQLRDRLAGAILSSEEQTSILQALVPYLQSSGHGSDAVALLKQLAERPDATKSIVLQSNALVQDFESRHEKRKHPRIRKGLEVAVVVVASWAAAYAINALFSVVYEPLASIATLVALISALLFGAYRVRKRWLAV